jgi:hypothetical protein
MKKTTVHDEDGEVVPGTRHKQVAANIGPSTPAVRKTEWPDFAGRLAEIWGKGGQGKPASKIIINERNERP